MGHQLKEIDISARIKLEHLVIKTTYYTEPIQQQVILLNKFYIYI